MLLYCNIMKIPFYDLMEKTGGTIVEKNSKNSTKLIEKSIFSNDNKSVESDPDRYLISNFLIKHPAILVTCISAVIAAVTAILNATVYVRESRILWYWGYNPAFVKIDDTNQLYTLVAAFLSCVLIAGTQSFVAKSVEIFKQQIGVIVYLRHAIKWISREIWHLKCSVFVHRIKIFRLKLLIFKERVLKRVDQYSEDIRNIEQELNKYILSLGDYSLTIKNLRKKAWQCDRAYFLHLLPSLVLTYIFMFFAIFILSLFMLSQAKTLQIVLAVGAISFIYISVPYALTRISAKRNMRNLIKKESDIFENPEKFNETFNSLIGSSIPQYPLESLLSLSFLSKPGNKKYISILIMTLFYVVYIFLVFSIILSNQTDRRQFSILDMDGTSYAIIYKDQDTYYLDEVEINQGSIKIYTNKQRIISSNDILYEVLTFTSVEKLTAKLLS